MGDLEARQARSRPGVPAFRRGTGGTHQCRQGLTRAELSVLISYSKIDLKESLLKSLVPTTTT